MLWCLAVLLTFVISICRTVDVWSAERRLSGPEVWNSDQRSGLGSTEKLLPVLLDPNDPNGDKFDLYYFVHRGGTGPSRKTVLFCPGGPGEITQISTAAQTLVAFLTGQGYDVVHFHLRGSGFSQIPPSSQFDRFLRTDYAVGDIEKIRRHFLGKDKQWDAVIGWSYGTVLAQQYAHRYSEKVKKLILLGPISRHDFAVDNFSRDFREIHRHSLTRILQLEGFDHVESERKTKIVEEVFGKLNEPGIFEKTEDAFGSLQFVIDNYCDLKQNPELETSDLKLKYSRDFFRKLRKIRETGWFPGEKTNQHKLMAIGKAIREEVLRETQQTQNDCLEKDTGTQASRRAFYVMGAYDGINPRFLKEWLSGGRTDIGSALRRSGGYAHVRWGLNEYLQKIGIFDSTPIEAWDPAKHKHEVPTLILKGGADPVSAAGQAEYLYSNGLLGPRALIELPGVGHEFTMPRILIDKDIKDIGGSKKLLSGTIRFSSAEILPGQIREVIGTANGPGLNEGHKMELKPPHASRLRHLGFSILEEEKVTGSNKSRNNVIALVANDAEGDISGKSIWTINNGYFTGHVYFDLPRIPPGETRSVTGTIIDGWRNKERLLQPEEPQTLERDFEFLCARRGGSHGRGPANYEFYFRNKNLKGSTDGRPQYWTVKYRHGNESVDVEVKPPSLGPGETNLTEVELVGLKPDPDAEIEIVETKLERGLGVPCVFSNENDGSKISILFHNKSDQPVRPPEQVTIRNASFDATFKMGDRKEIAPQDTVNVSGTLSGVNWRTRLELVRPSGLEPELELLGFNILEEDRVSILLRNNGRKKIMATARNWVYVDPKKPSVCQDKEKSLDCLIYSFLVMDAKDFINEKDNRIVNIIRSMFTNSKPKESLPINIEYCDEGVCQITN